MKLAKYSKHKIIVATKFDVADGWRLTFNKITKSGYLFLLGGKIL
jgi:hypothetical protein